MVYCSGRIVMRLQNNIAAPEWYCGGRTILVTSVVAVAVQSAAEPSSGLLSLGLFENVIFFSSHSSSTAVGEPWSSERLTSRLRCIRRKERRVLLLQCGS